METKMLKQVKQDAKQFQRHHEVKFAEHFLQLVEAKLANMTAFKEVWNEQKANGDRGPNWGEIVFLSLTSLHAVMQH